MLFHSCFCNNIGIMYYNVIVVTIGTFCIHIHTKTIRCVLEILNMSLKLQCTFQRKGNMLTNPTSKLVQSYEIWSMNYFEKHRGHFDIFHTHKYCLQ